MNTSPTTCFRSAKRNISRWSPTWFGRRDGGRGAFSSRRPLMRCWPQPSTGCPNRANQSYVSPRDPNDALDPDACNHPQIIVAQHHEIPMAGANAGFVAVRCIGLPCRPYRPLGHRHHSVKIIDRTVTLYAIASDEEATSGENLLVVPPARISGQPPQGQHHQVVTISLHTSYERMIYATVWCCYRYMPSSKGKHNGRRKIGRRFRSEQYR